jgi:sugar phosphate isomerase/epimerase
MKFCAMDVVIGKADATTLRRARHLGMDGIEINLTIRELGSDRWKRLADDARELELEIPSAVLGEHNSGGIATWWRGKDADDEIAGALHATAELGATTLLVPFFFFNEPKGRSHRAAVANRLKPLCETAEALEVVIAFEGVLPTEHLIEMSQSIASPAFGVYVDPANITWCDMDAPTQIRQFGKLVRQVHGKDASTFTGDARLGRGRVDHAACAQALREIGYDRWIVLETPGGSDDEIASDLAFARKTYT